MKSIRLALTLILVTSPVAANSATPQFEQPVQSMESSQLRHIGKFDGDSFQDLLLTYQDRIFFRKGDGKGNFGQSIASTITNKIFDTTHTAVGDLTGDSIDDFVYVVPFGKAVNIYQGSSSGVFSMYRSIEINFSIDKPVIGQFNSDRYSDLLITSTDSWGSNYFFEGGSSGVNPNFSEYKGGFYPRGFWCEVSQSANISPTGSPALLCMGSSAIGVIPMISATQPGQVSGYASLYTYPEDKDYAVGDLNGDNLLDLVAIRGVFDSARIQIFENSYLGLNSPLTLSTNLVSWRDHIFVSDIDGDKRSDIVLFRPNGQTLYALNLGDLRFQAFHSIANTISNENLIVKDINNDLIGDFVFSGNNRISVLITRNAVQLEAEAVTKAKADAEAKAAAELKAKQEAEAKAAAELKAKQEAEAKAAAELKAKQEAEAKAAAEKLSATKAAALRKITITCVKGKLTKKVTAMRPVCQSGYKKK